MKILITGNMGYVGPAVVSRLRERYPAATLHGFDSGFFAHCLTGVDMLPERILDLQYFGDVRDLTSRHLSGYDAVVQLAAVSNDPMGKYFENVTDAINRGASVALAEAAHEAGVKSFVFASSCSIYGIADGPPRREGDPVNPVTAYAHSKVATEETLRHLGTDMTVTCLRFSTACGMSARLRLDLVLNDFVACAVTRGVISILSDGTPWRPMIDTIDMARAIDWAIGRTPDTGGRFLSVNVGSDDRNYQVRDIAEAARRVVPGTNVSVNSSAPVDSRSYRVDFSLYRELAPEHQPQVTLDQSASMLRDGMDRMGFGDADFRNTQLIRLKVLKGLVRERKLSNELRWAPVHANAPLGQTSLSAA